MKARARPPRFEIGGVEVQSGSRATVHVPVARRYTHTEVFLTVHVVRGKIDGIGRSYQFQLGAKDVELLKGASSWRITVDGQVYSFSLKGSRKSIDAAQRYAREAMAAGQNLGNSCPPLQRYRPSTLCSRLSRYCQSKRLRPEEHKHLFHHTLSHHLNKDLGKQCNRNQRW